MPLPVAAIPALIQGGTGLLQLIGSLGSNPQRPKYEIPSALRSALGVAQMMASNPNIEGYSQAVDQINTTTANMVAGAQQAGNAQESIASIAAAQGGQVRDLAQMNEQGQRQDLQGLQQMLQVYSQAQDQEFQMNEFAPYADKAQEKRDVFGAGLENIMGGASSFALLGQLGGFGGMLGQQGAGQGAAGGAGSTNVPGGVNLMQLFSTMLSGGKQGATMKALSDAMNSGLIKFPM